MIISAAADLEQLASAALAEARKQPLRSATRRAAASVDAALRAVASFGDTPVQKAAVDLLHRLAAELAAGGR